MLAFYLMIFALIVVIACTLWTLSRAPEGMENDAGFQLTPAPKATRRHLVSHDSALATE